MNHYLNAIFLVQLEGVNRGMQIRQSASPLWFIKQIRPSILALIPKSVPKKKMNPQSARCNCRILKIR